MTPRVKTILAVLIAITLVGVGYFFIKPKSEILPPVNTAPKVEEIDTSDWQTYRNEKLGFEIKMPKEWVKSGEDIGPQPFLEDEFWQEQVGGARFNGPFRVLSSPQFNVRVKDSDLTLEKVMNKFGVTKEHQDLIIASLPAKKDVLERKGEFPDYREKIAIQNGKRYYFFEFSASEENTDQDILIWNEILKTFKPASQ